MSIKVLVVGEVLDPKWRGGEPLIARSIVDGLKRRNFEVQVYTKLRHYKDHVGSLFSLEDVNTILYKKYRFLLKSSQPDAVLSFYDYDCSICLAAFKENVPLIVSVNIWWPICPALTLYVEGQGLCGGPDALHCITHMANISRNPISKNPFISVLLYAKFLKRINLLNTAKRIVVPSYYMKSKLSLFGIKNISVIPYGINVDEIEPVKQCSHNRKLVVNPTGYTDERKGFPHFFVLANKLQKEFNGKVSFVAAGYSGKGIVEGDGYLPRNKLIKLLQSSYLVVIPSLWEEPFGIVALEAMAAGKPVVAYNSGALSEIVVNGVTGFLVPRGDLKALIHAVRYLLNDEELAAKMGIEGRKRVEQYFNLNRMINLYIHELLKIKPDV